MTEFIRQSLALVRPYRTRLVLGILCGILSGLSTGAMVLTIQLVVAAVFPGAQEFSLATQLKSAPEFVRAPVESLVRHLAAGHVSSDRLLVVLAICLVPLVMLARSVVGYLNVYLLEWVSARAVTDLRMRLFNHLVGLSLDRLKHSSTGDLISRITNDTSSVQRVINNCLPTLVRDPVQVAALGGLLLWKQPVLTLISLVVAPLVVVPIAVYSRKARKAARSIQETYAELSSLTHEVFTGHRVIKAYNLERAVVQQFAAAGRRFIGHYMRVLRSMEIPGPMVEFFGAVGVAGVLLYLTLIETKPIAPSELVAFIGSIFFLYAPIKALTRVNNQLVQSRAASQRVFELLAMQSSLPEPPQPKPLRAAGAGITFEKVEFGYDRQPVVCDINLEIKPGQLVALVGQSGSGKTTLTNLLLRFYDPQRGAVRIGGLDLREISTRDLRSQIALVTQETILFNETLGSNIALGRAGATQAEIETAAKHAHAHDFIMERPSGYESLAGEKGANLSGGQRQRIAIARAILRDAPILVLDEATSALDSESERAVQAALDELMQGRTTICIAHRLSTIQKADLIVVLDRGRIVETGTHAQLIERRGIYSKLYELQYGG
jgi:subfamily B ATP-binding cassette protein MsbA